MRDATSSSGMIRLRSAAGSSWTSRARHGAGEHQRDRQPVRPPFDQARAPVIAQRDRGPEHRLQLVRAERVERRHAGEEQAGSMISPPPPAIASTKPANAATAVIAG